MSTQTEIKNDDISLTIKRDPGCKVTLDVTVSPSRAQAVHRDALKRVKKEVSIPGFRKGRAPDNVILQKFGSHVDSEWQNLLVQSSFEMSCDLARVSPFDQHSLKRPKLESCSREEGARVQFEFESEPEVPEVDYKELSLKVEAPREVTDEQIQSTLRDIQVVHADWEDVNDRGVAVEDYVDLTIESLDDPGKIICEDKRFEMRDGKIGKWLMDLLVDKKIGDTFEGTSQLDEDQADQIKNFKPTQLKITVNGIKSIVLPELNDELAQKVGLESVDQLRQKLREDLESAAKQEAKDKMKEALEEALLERYPFDVPSSLEASEKRGRLHSHIEALKAEGFSEDDIKEKMTEIEETVHNDVTRSLRSFFIFRKVAEAEGIGATQEDLSQELSRQLWSVPEHQRIIDPHMEPQEMRSRLMMKIVMDKTKDFLLDNVSAK